MQNTLKKTDFQRTFKALKRRDGFLSAIVGHRWWRNGKKDVFIWVKKTEEEEEG